MEPQIGATVLDNKGKSLGSIDYVMRDTWTGEIKKCMIYNKPPDKDLIFTVDDISEATESVLKLNISSTELIDR
ncbi:hypothetical protein ACFLYN_06745 [Chloroflexota bacterium]